MPFDVVRAAIRTALGRSTEPAASHRDIELSFPTGRGDAGPSSTRAALDRGRWLQPDVEHALAMDALDAGALAVTTAFGEFRMTWPVPLSRTVRPPPPPRASTRGQRRHRSRGRHGRGVVSRDGETVTLHGDEHVLTVVVDGYVADRTPVAAAAPIGRVPRARGAGSLCPLRGAYGAAPTFPRSSCRRSSRRGGPSPATTSRCCRTASRWSPARTMQTCCAAAPRASRRYRSTTTRPRRGSERGWREHLISTTGRSYLDMVNNVAVLGHGDLELADAVAHQMLRLNTNSRFVYESVVAFSEQLAATLPPPLDTVFLVNSGSEADDLALRLAMAATGRTDVVAVGEAYHGWTYATDAVSTSVADNPNALSTRPSWVHVVDAPNSYRGKYRGSDATEYACDAVAAQIERLAETGRAPAAFICEPYYGNAGDAAASRLPGDGLRAGAPARGPVHRRRGAGRVRVPGAVVLGASSSRPWCPTSSPLPRRWATATRSAPW